MPNIARSAPGALARPGVPGSLFHPAVDFLLVGGLSLFAAAPIFFLMHDKAAFLPGFAFLGFILSLFINFPHFAFSYQILYAGIGRRILGAGSPRKVRLKYLWAGFLAPALIAGFLLFAYWRADARIMSYAANAMLFFVGWHYVKQGYGVMIVLSAIRRIFYTDGEKRLLLANGYAVWIYSWMALNDAFKEETLFGLKYLTLGIPSGLLNVAAIAAGATTVAVCLAFGRRVLARKQPVSWNGAIGYGCALYLWVIARYIDPLFSIVVPMFHSLQYILFVWRYELNRQRAGAPPAGAPAPTALPSRRLVALRLALFAALGFALGWLGFIGLPGYLDRHFEPEPNVWGTPIFAFMFVIWINIHHYFIDNVIWRRDNEDVRKFLFAPR